MIMQKQFLDFMPKLSTPQTAPEIKKAELPDKMQYAKFEDILGQSVVKERVRVNPERTAENRHAEENAEKPVQFKAFREIADRTANVKQPKESGKTENLKEDTGVVEKEDIKTSEKANGQNNPALNLLAQLFGVKPQDMETLLGAANVKLEDLSDSSKIQGIVEKLSQLTGLNKEQQATLARVLEEISKQVPRITEAVVTKEDIIPANAGDEVSSKTVIASEKADVREKPIPEEKMAAPEEMKVSTGTTLTEKIGKTEGGTEKPEVTEEFSEIVSTLKSKLEEMTQSMQKDPSKFMTTLAASIKELLTKEKTDEKLPDAVSMEIPTDEEPAAVSTVKTEKETQTGAAEKDMSKDFRGDKKESLDIGKEAKVPDDGEKTDTSVKTDKSVEQVTEAGKETAAVKTTATNPAEQGIAAVQKDSTVELVARQTKDSPVSKQEIIRQVVEKAKVVVTGEKSEMVMDLKPDSLGKLTLKVVTERGMVVAKFTAESQQVKEVLETNMQLLKDTLEKQGLAVQNFSVSVGHNQSNGQRSYREMYADRETAPKGMDRIQTGTAGVSGTLEMEKRINPYAWNGSKINLTA